MKGSALRLRHLRSRSSAEKENDHVQFAVVQIDKSESEFVMRQKRYLSRLETLPKDADFSKFRSLRALLSWLAQTRPEIRCTVAQPAQVTQEMFRQEPLNLTKSLNSEVRHLEKCPAMSLNILHLLKDQFGHRYTLMPHLETIIMFHHSLAISYSSLITQIFVNQSSCHPTTRNMYLAQYLESKLWRSLTPLTWHLQIRNDLSKILSQKLPIVMSTDRPSLFDVVTKAKLSTEKDS